MTISGTKAVVAVGSDGEPNVTVTIHKTYFRTRGEDVFHFPRVNFLTQLTHVVLEPPVWLSLLWLVVAVAVIWEDKFRVQQYVHRYTKTNYTNQLRRLDRAVVCSLCHLPRGRHYGFPLSVDARLLWLIVIVAVSLVLLMN